MQIQGVNNLDNSIGTLQSIKGDVTNNQLSSLTQLFSSNVWNTKDNAGTTIERQIRDLEALLDEIQAKIDKLYDEQKESNEEMNALINDMNEESFQASKQADKNIKQQQDLVSSATDEAYNKYMKGDIEKEEIPSYIAKALGRGNSGGGAALEGHLSAMDAKGQKITSLSNKIAAMLDSINEYKAQYQTTQTSLDLLNKLKAQIPQHKERADIQSTTERPYFNPSQEALGDKLIDQFKVAAGGSDQFSTDNPAVQNMNKALTGSGTVVDDARKGQLDSMSAEDKAAAVEEADLSKYSAAELMYMSGMDATQAAYALGDVFRGAGVGYNSENGALIVPMGHGDAQKMYDELENQFKTLWGGTIEEGSMSENGNKGGADPIGWREGNTNFMFAVDRDNDNVFDGANEFLGAQNGWAELAQYDINGDGILTADEADQGGLRIVEVDQDLKNSGAYGFNGVKEAGFESLDLNSYKSIDNIKSTNLNGNTRLGEFSLTVDGQETLGKQTENQDAYNEAFYGHMYGEAYSFGLDPNEVADALSKAAKKEDYMSVERSNTEQKAENAKELVDNDKARLNAKDETLKGINANAANINGAGLNREEDEKKPEEETATNTTDTTASAPSTSTQTTQTDDYIPEF